MENNILLGNEATFYYITHKHNITGNIYSETVVVPWKSISLFSSNIHNCTKGWNTLIWSFMFLTEHQSQTEQFFSFTYKNKMNECVSLVPLYKYIYNMWAVRDQTKSKQCLNFSD